MSDERKFILFAVVQDALPVLLLLQGLYVRKKRKKIFEADAHARLVSLSPIALRSATVSLSVRRGSNV